MQRVGWVTAALGISQTGLIRLGDRYSQALAQPTSRKLALLVGINQYANTSLTGCLTDVELQRELLIHRFGFQPADILVLTNQDATRQKITEAFIHHLIEQAGENDAIAFHFSGFGRRVRTGETAATIQNTLVPVDGELLIDGQERVNDLLEDTLQLLWRSLSTDQVTTVLDTSYIDTGNCRVGNLRIRSRPSQLLSSSTDAEQAFQEELLAQIDSQPQKNTFLQRSGQLPGVVLAAASSSSLSPGEKALEAQWNGFSAGLFTYALTQYLWVATPATTLHISLSRASGVVEQLAGSHQVPTLTGQDAKAQSLPVYYLTPNAPWGADGAIAAVEEDGQTAQLWLGGLPASTIESYGINSILTVAQASEEGEAAQLQIRSREGLTAKAKLQNPETASKTLQEGQLVQESIRIIPRNVSLTVAINAELERIERVDATSAFSSTPHISTIVTGESPQPADCLFGKVREADLVKMAATSAKSEGSYGLFSPSHNLIANTIGDKGEAVKTAVRRIVPQLQALRAAKLMRLTDNVGSSRLQVKAVLEMAAPQERILMQREPIRGKTVTRPQFSEKFEDEMLALPIGSRIRYRLENQESRPIYFLLFGLDDTGSIISISRPSSVTISPIQSSNKPTSNSEAEVEGVRPPIFKQEVIPAGSTLIVPQAFDSVEWAIAGPMGLAETLLVFSVAPFGNTLDALKIAKSSTIGDDKSAGTLLNPLEVAQAMLQDLQEASQKLTPTLETSADAYALDTKAWATLRFIYRVM